MPDVETTSAEVEGRHHNYVGNRIPWYVRLIWLFFWCFAAAYVVKFLIPALQVELLLPK